MFNNNYRYNKKTLQFEKVDYTSRKEVIRLTLTFVGAVSLVLATVIGVLVVGFDYKSVKMFQRENQTLRTQYDQLNQRISQMTMLMSDIEKRDDNLYRFLLNSKPLPKQMRAAGYGGSEKYRHLESSNYSDILIATSKKVDKLSKKVIVQSKSFDDVFAMAKKQTDMLKHIPALQPVSSKHSHLSSKFGVRFHPIYKCRKMHTGLDFSAPKGTPIYAPGDGKVIAAKFSSGYGREIIINHGYGYVTRYAHLNRVDVKRGDKIKRGEVIGTVGNSGLSTGPHLHYEIMKDGNKINPIAFFFPDLTPEEFLQSHDDHKHELAR